MDFAGVPGPEQLGFESVGGIISALIRPIYAVGAMLAVLFLIWGGIRYMTARGDPKAVDSARSTVTSAVIGLLIVLLVGVIYALIAAVFKIQIFGDLPGSAYAAVDIGKTVKLDGLTIGAAFGDFGEFITAIVRFALAAAAFIFFIMLLWGGFRYLNAGGDPKNADAARQTLTNAGIGLLIVLVSLFIIEVVLRVTGTGTSIF